MNRLLIVSEPGLDGVFVYVRSLIRHLHRRHPDIRVDWAFSSRRDSAGARELVAEVAARGGWTFDMRTGNAPEPRDARIVLDLARAARRGGVQLVHAHSSKAGAVARLAALAPGFPPVLYTPHAYYGMPRKGGAKERVFNAIETAFGRIGSTHNCSEDERDFAARVLRVPPASLSVIHHGIDLARFAPATAAERDALRGELGLPVGAKLLVTVGRDSGQKNYGPLYAALDVFLPGSALFAHAGHGSRELRGSLSPAARERAFAFDHLERPEMLLRAADGFILTSRYEGLSLSMLEAIGCGLPLLLTDAPGFGLLRALGFSDVHWMANPARTEDVRRALDEWAEQSGANAHRELACRYFDEGRQLEEIVRLYRELSDDASRR